MSPLASILTRVKRRSTVDTQATLERKETFDLEDGPQSPRTQTFPLLSQLYDEASEYEKILLRSGCMNSEGGCSDQETTAFIKLVGHDLSSCEKALAARNEKVFATNKPWIPGRQIQPDGIIDESEESSLGDSQSSGSGSARSSSATSGFDPSVPSIHRPVIHDSSGDLEPDEILNLIIEEFGPLAPPNDEEKLLLETDGCLIHDVAVVGVIHLTTHRLTFHASLFATRPDIAPGRQVLKAGPATFHRKGWRGKRRVWLELLPDMICAYASSKEQDKWRPISTLLLAHIRGAEPQDPKRPRLIRLEIDPSAQMVNDYTEFDTEESAHDWRKELGGALFNYRHLRKEAYSSPSDSTNGVRLSLPLTQITKLEASPNDQTFHSVLELTVKLSASDFIIDKEAVPDTQVFKIGPIQNIPAWQRLGDIIAESKLRQIRQGSMPPPPCPVVVDFGPYNFFETVPNKSNTDQEVIENEAAIRATLGFSPETAIWVARARLYRTVTCTGYIVLSKDELGFWSKNITQQDVKYRIRVADVQSAKPFRMNWRNLEGATLKLTNGHEAKFIFKSVAVRDEAVQRLNAILHPSGSVGTVSTASTISDFSTEIIAGEPLNATILDAQLTTSPPASIHGTPSPSPRPTPTRKDTYTVLAPLSRSLAAAIAASTKLPKSATDKIPKAINIPSDTLFTRQALHFVCLTIGSRGDVQPYIALGLGLKKEGHNVTIVTHEEYGDWIRGFGINHRTAGGDPGALMKLSVENKMFSPEFFRESLTNFRPWLDQLLVDSWEGCRDADVLLESPSAMAGVHIAEALNIPYFRTFTMPWTKTTEFPHAFLSTSVESPTFNAASYVLYGNVIWAATSNQINRWRRNTLKLENTDMGHLAQSKITFIYNFSKAVVPKPLDWPDTTIVSGYWFLDNPEMSWTPPDELVAFMDKARADGKPIVYIGFGSVTVPRPNKVTNAVIKAVLLSDVRAIISKGWSARMHKGEDKDPEPVIPPECFMLDKVPHDWLFPRVDAALHHGGAGTTGASLRAGIPTLIKPWFGDQYFWASRVQKLGAGLRVPSLHASDLSDALTKATRSEVMKAKAASVGEQIRQENGVHTSIHAIYTYLHRAGQDRTSLS